MNDRPWLSPQRDQHPRWIAITAWGVLLAIASVAQGQYPKAPVAPGSEPVTASWLGICSLELSGSERGRLKILGVEGAPVAGVYPGSPAEAADLHMGDVIVEINGRTITSSEQLANWNAPAKPSGDVLEPAANPAAAGEAELVYQREGTRWRVTLKPVAPPADLADTLLKSAEAGQAWAQYELASLLRTVHPPKSLQAQVWLREAADQGLAVAQSALGMMLLAGEGSAPDTKQGMEWLIEAGVSGLESAQFALGLSYLYGIGLEVNEPAAAYWLLQAAEEGNATCQFLVGCLYEELQPPDHAGALYWLKLAGEQNLPEANAMISVFHRNGWGVPKSDAEANKYLLLAAHAGHAHSQFLFGQVCAQALGVQQDHKAAVGWYRAAANKGDVDAQTALGMCYKTGEGVTADPAEARKWLEKAAETGDPVAQYNRAMSSTTTEESVSWFKRAALAGNAEAQCMMGMCYAGGYGVPKSRTAATFWYQKAIAQGHEKAKEQLKNLAVQPR